MSLTSAVHHQHSRPFLAAVPAHAGAAEVADVAVCPALVRKADLLRKLSFFAATPDAELFRLAEASLFRRFERGRTVLRAGATEDCVILVEGRARNSTPRGVACGEFALGLFEAGDILWEGCWASQAISVETIALEPSIVLFLPRRSFDAFLARNALAAIRLLEAMATRLHRTMDLAMRNSCLEVGDRLYRKLAEISASRSRRLPDGRLRIEHGLSQGELGASISASREAVNRQIAIWREMGLVEAGRKFVLVHDPLGLTMAVSQAVRGVTFGVPEHSRA